MTSINNSLTSSFMNNDKITIKNAIDDSHDDSHNIYIDDTIGVVIKKINTFLCNKYDNNSNNIFAWYIRDKIITPLNFIYDNVKFINPIDIDNKIDKNFIDKNENIKYQNIIYLDNLLLNSIKEDLSLDEIPKIYFIHFQDFLLLKGIKNNVKYNNSNWPSTLPNISLFYHGIVKKYWPKIELKMMTNHILNKREKDIESILKNSNEMINNINKNEKIDCLNNNISILKINTDYNKNNIQVNIIRLFSDLKLNNKIPFVKLILDNYSDSYYKLFKNSIYTKIIQKHTINHWIKDFKTDNQLGYNKYINYNNVIIFKLYHGKNHCSLIIHKNGNIELIIDRIKLKNLKNDFYEYTNNDIIDKNMIENFIKISNEFLEKNISYFIGLNDPITIDNKCLIDNTGSSKIDFINCELFFERINWNSKNINYLFDNLYTYTRRIHEKYYYKLKNEESVYLRYKRVNNYNNEDTIDSIISSLSNPRLGLDLNDIIENIKKNFDLTIEDATEKYNEWWDKAQNKISNNKKYFSIFSSSEPGVEMNIIQRVGSNHTIVELNGIGSFDELNRILIFLKTSFYIYNNNGILGDINLFNKINKNKKIQDKIDEKEKGKYKNDIVDDLLEGEEQEKYINPVVIADDAEGLGFGEEETGEYVDPFLIDTDTDTDDEGDEGDDMVGGGEIDITRYTMRRLTNEIYDPNLFRFKALQKQPSGADLTYSKICDASTRRQPIVLTNKELKNIDDNDEKIGSKSYYKPPGEDSLKFGSTKEKKEELNYICPRYWDIENNISLPPDKKYDPYEIYNEKPDEELNKLLDKLKIKKIDPNIKKNEKYSKTEKLELSKLIVDNTDIKVPEGMWDARNIIPIKTTKGKVKQTIYDRKGSQFWKNTKDGVEDFIIGSLGPGYREDNIDMPCCFTRSSLKKKDPLNVVKSDFIIGYQIPSGDDTISKLNMKFNDLMKIDIDKSIDKLIDKYSKDEDKINNIRKIKDIIKLIKSTNKTKSIKDIEKYIKPEYYQEIKDLIKDQDIDIDKYCKGEVIIDNMRQIKDIIKKIKHTNTKKSIEDIKEYINNEYYQKIKTTETTNKGLKDIYLYGLLKIGIGKQNTESLLYSFAKIFGKTIKDFKTELEEKITIDVFQNTNLFNIFKRSTPIKEETISDFKKPSNFYVDLSLLDFTNSEVFFKEIQSINTDKDMIKYLQSKDNNNMKTYSYIYELYISWTNYKKYIKSDEYKNDIYFTNIIENIYKCNVIIFEDIYDSIKIKTPLKNTRKYDNYIFIIKKDIYYEPLFYKSELESDKRNKIFDVLDFKGPDKYLLDLLNRYDNINVDNLFILNRENNPKYDTGSNDYLSEILDKIDEFIDPHMDILNNSIEKLNDKDIIIDTFYIDGYNLISHFITNDNYIIPIKPIYQQYNINNDFKKIYDLNDIKKYHTLSEYKLFLKTIKGLIKSNIIDGIIVENGFIVNILVNHSYIPITPEPYTTKIKYTIKGSIDLRMIDKDIQINNIFDNKSNIFNANYEYEMNINNIFNENIINYLSKHKIIDNKIDVDDPSVFEPLINTIVTLDKDNKLTNDIDDIHNMGLINNIKGNKLDIQIKPLKFIDQIIDDNLRINEDKRILLYSMIYHISKLIVVSGVFDINKYIELKTCFNEDKCDYPCKKDEDTCKLLIQEDSYNGKNLLKKFAWKFVDLLLINRGDLNQITFYKIEPYELEKTKKENEYFFTYKDYLDGDILNYFFHIQSDYINNMYII